MRGDSKLQLPTNRRSEFFEDLLEIFEHDRLLPTDVMKAYERAFEDHAKRLGALCNVAGCSFITRHVEESFGNNSVDIYDVCPEHGRVEGLQILVVGFVPDNYIEKRLP